MPNPELSQYHDHDTDTLYDYKDAKVRETLATVQADIRKSIISISTMANGQDADYTDWLFMSALNNGYFVGQDQAFVRIHFNSSLVSYTKPVRFIYYFDETHGQGVYICNVVTNYSTMENLGGHYKQGDVLDFIFFKLTNTFVLVGPSDSVDLSNYYTKTQTDTLLNTKVSDNPTFSEAATRQNIASGETFAVILGKIKKFFADLKTVAFSGDYNDLTNKPTIPAAQVQADWNEADNTAADYIKNKPTIPAAQVNSDWNANSGVAEILNKPSLATVATTGNYNDLDYKPTFSSGTGINIRGSGYPGYDWDYEIEFTGDADEVDYDNSHSGLSATNVEDAIDELAAEKADVSSLARVATSGDYDDLLNKPTIPAAQIQSDWTQSNSGAVDYIKNKPSLATVATSGNYSDLNGKPTLPGNYKHASNSMTINNSSLTQITSISLTKGYWLVFGSVSFANNANGRRAASLFFSDQSTTIDEFIVTQPPISGGATHMQVHGIYYASGNVTAYVQAWQNSGSNLTGCGGRIAAVFISA